MIIGYDIVMEAGEGLVHFDWTNEEFLMAVASITAFFIGEAQEAVMVMWLYQLGELLTDMAVDLCNRIVNGSGKTNIQPKTHSHVRRFVFGRWLY